jgi:hypothetical protein
LGAPTKNTRSFSMSDKTAQIGTPASRSTARWKLMFNEVSSSKAPQDTKLPRGSHQMPIGNIKTSWIISESSRRDKLGAAFCNEEIGYRPM